MGDTTEKDGFRENLEAACLEGLVLTEHGYRYRPSVGADAVLRLVRATSETVWGVAFCGDDQVDEWYTLRSDAESYITFARDMISAGQYDADDYEPIRLMQTTRTEFRPIEGAWTPVSRPGEVASDA